MTTFTIPCTREQYKKAKELAATKGIIGNQQTYKGVTIEWDYQPPNIVVYIVKKTGLARFVSNETIKTKILEAVEKGKALFDV